MEIGFRWNPLYGTIEEQANRQGFTLGDLAEEINRFQDDMLLMHMEGILTDSMYDKLLLRLHKYTVKKLKPLGGNNEKHKTQQ